MDYNMDELVPIVGKLAEKYTAAESTSIPYEKAEQLMGAVLYCIHQLKEQDTAVAEGKIPAQRAYEIGYIYVKEKTEKALNLYNQILPEFNDYGNQCLYDTFVCGIPEFFRWYDLPFEPQSTIITLDYPVLKDISPYTGIDKIYAFIQCICLEQKFLRLFPADSIFRILAEADRYDEESLENLCEMVVDYLVKYFLGDISFQSEDLEETVSVRIRKLLMREGGESSEGGADLWDYLSGTVHSSIVRLKISARHKGNR